MNATKQVAAETACWSCAGDLGSSPFFCASCGKLQPLRDTDFFQVFRLDRKLVLDISALEKRFYQQSRKLHPDLHAGASEDEQQWSLASTSLLNDAYRTLKDPIARTEYLLRMEGGLASATDPLSATDSKPASDASRVPADLLQEVFDLNMQLEEMRMNQKMGEDDPLLRKDLDDARAQFEAQLTGTNTQLDAERAHWDKALETSDKVDQQQTKDKMSALLDRRRYLLNLVRDVKGALGFELQG